jgi:ankyrin repeat protein
LIHYTTQEYFERTQKYWFPCANKDIATTCITYLSFKIFDTTNVDVDFDTEVDYDTDVDYGTDEEVEQRFQHNRFYSYAVQHWAYHVNTAQMERDEVVLTFLNMESNISTLIQAAICHQNKNILDDDNAQNPPSRTYGLHVAAYFSLEETTHILVDAGHLPDKIDSSGRTPLSYAAANGHEAVAIRLLSSSKVNADAKDTEGQTPLSYAAGYGHVAIAGQLLSSGKVDPNSLDLDFFRSPLSWAAMNGHTAVVKLLLENGHVNPDHKDCAVRTPLSLAAENGHTDVVKHLLATGGVDPESMDENGDTPLLLSAEENHLEVTRLLFEHIHQIDTRVNDSFIGVFSLVLSSREEDLIQKLLEEPGNIARWRECLDSLADKARKERSRLQNFS